MHQLMSNTHTQVNQNILAKERFLSSTIFSTHVRHLSITLSFLFHGRSNFSSLFVISLHLNFDLDQHYLAQFV